MAFQPTKMSSTFPLLPQASPFKVDEGYSEDSRSQTGSETTEMIGVDTMEVQTQDGAAQEWLLAQPVESRANFVRILLASLPNPSVADLVEEANQRLHFDPVVCLPQEIISYIFGYLDAATLVRASLVSKTWNNRATDVRLWRGIFSQEGWAVNIDAIRALSEEGEKRDVQDGSASRTRRRSGDAMAESPSVKRVRDASYPADITESPLSWSEQHGVVEADGDDEKDTSDLKGEAHERLLIPQELGKLKPNWHYLYNQRRRLEQNWLAGRFTNFRLPRIEAQDQAHSQCVYTVQYSNNYVVSGSRDNSVRVWDLKTQELRMPPLLGHSGSVLCLQFDERPEQDIIISGGSDADVIAWQFSTGKMIKRLHRAHTDSVLNLRFDDRYLVTCSKDKTIRIWNRRDLLPTDEDYPDRGTGAFRNAQYPDHIIDIPKIVEDEDVMVVQPTFDPLPAFSLLMTFDGHQAAVNAIQIFKDEVVSASGDRKIMLWNIKTGTLTRTYTGHTKGIACVQYDGRRIVSGSSDNTVRIFDSQSSAEVAMLEGHRNLVRTVQAEFGDLPGDADLLEAEARDNDERLRSNSRNPRMLPHAKPWLQRYFVYGAKLPPGGGGNRWSKIVSGSYDETVLIWRRDREGRWFIAKELLHEHAMLLASGQSVSTSTAHARRFERAVPDTRVAAAAAAAAAVQQAPGIQPNNWMRPDRSSTPRTEGLNTASSRPLSNPSASVPVAQPSQHYPVPQVTAQHAVAQNVAPHQSQQHGAAHPLHSVPAAPPRQRGAVQPQQAATNMPGGWPNHQLRAVVQHQRQQQQQTPPPHQNQQHMQHRQYPQQLPQHQHPQHPQQLASGPNSRVFKLQFDARRIICCSQEPVIVGWDFANGDEAIIEASEYFGEPS